MAGARHVRTDWKDLGIGLLSFHELNKAFPPWVKPKAGDTAIISGTNANVLLLPYLPKSRLQDHFNADDAWYLQSTDAVRMKAPEFLCPADIAPTPSTYPWIAASNLPAGDTFENSSYGYSMGYSDAICYARGRIRTRPTTRYTGVFAINSDTRIRDITDGTSNTFAMGEAASGFDICPGVGCDGPVVGTSKHGWLIGGSNFDAFYAAGFHYSGNLVSTVDRINKLVATDSMQSTHHPYDCRPSWANGPHWATNFRSFHPGGANFLFCDGRVKFIKENVDMNAFRALSTIRGGE